MELGLLPSSPCLPGSSALNLQFPFFPLFEFPHLSRFNSFCMKQTFINCFRGRTCIISQNYKKATEVSKGTGAGLEVRMSE